MVNTEKPEVTPGLSVAVCRIDCNGLPNYYAWEVVSVTPKQFVIQDKYRNLYKYRLSDWSAIGLAPDIQPLTPECTATNMRTSLIQEISSIKLSSDIRSDASLEEVQAAHAALMPLLKPKVMV